MEERKQRRKGSTDRTEKDRKGGMRENGECKNWRIEWTTRNDKNG